MFSRSNVFSIAWKTGSQNALVCLLRGTQTVKKRQRVPHPLSLPPSLRALSLTLYLSVSLSDSQSLARSLSLLPSPSLSLRHLEDECVWKDALAGKREN